MLIFRGLSYYFFFINQISAAFAAMDRALTRALGSLRKQSGEALAAQRYQKFRAMGDPAGKKERA